MKLNKAKKPNKLLLLLVIVALLNLFSTNCLSTSKFNKFHNKIKIKSRTRNNSRVTSLAKARLLIKKQLDFYNTNNSNMVTPPYVIPGESKYFDSIAESRNSSPLGKLAVSNGMTANGLPVDAGFMSKMYKPKYVEKLGYYDEPPSQRDVETTNITNPAYSGYYMPFQRKGALVFQ